MANTPITGVDELEKHLDNLLRDSELVVNVKLLDDVELQLTGMCDGASNLNNPPCLGFNNLL